MKNSTNKNPGKWIGLGLTIGAGIGIIIGQMFNFVFFGIPIGAGIGMIIALLLGYSKENSDDLDGKGNEDK